MAATTLAGSTAVPLTITNSMTGSQALTALEILPTWNTSGAATAIDVNATCTSCASALLMNLSKGGVSQFKVDTSGFIYPKSGVAISSGFTLAGYVMTANTNTAATIGQNVFNAAGTMVKLGNNGAAATNSSGVVSATTIAATYNQTSTAGATDLIINRTETAVGSGAQYFQDWQVGGTSKGHLDHLGVLTLPNLAATNTGDVNLCWTTTGTFTQGAVCGSSLLAHKNNIVALEHGLDYVMQMRPVTYNRIATGARELGMIADWTASIDPLLGAYDKTGDLQNFRDRAVMAVMIRAIQEQQIEIDSLKASILRLAQK